MNEAKNAQGLQCQLEKIRKAVNLSQAALGERAYFSQNTVSQFETGARELKTSVFEHLLAAMGVTMECLFYNEKGDVIHMETSKHQVPDRPIDCREIRSEEGFRLWALQQNPDSLVVDVEENRFVVYKKEQDGALFWLYLDTFDRRKLVRICQEEQISYEEIG